MPETALLSARARRAASTWTLVHPLFAIGQLFAFFVSAGLLVAYFRGVVPFHTVHVSVLVKIGLMLGAVITGALWERDVFGFYWFAPEFLFEDVMTLIVFLFQISYLAMVALHPDNMPAVIGMLCVAYAVYVANVAQYIHRTQRDKQRSVVAQRELKRAA